MHISHMKYVPRKGTTNVFIPPLLISNVINHRAFALFIAISDLTTYKSHIRTEDKEEETVRDKTLIKIRNCLVDLCKLLCTQISLCI